MNKKEKILIIIPAKNEEKTIGNVIEEIRAVIPEASILVVIDECSDQTEKISVENGARVLKLPVSLGIGGAIKAGYRYAYDKGYQIVLQVDADGQHDPKEIEKILIPIKKNMADLCIGSRFLEKKGFQSSIPRRLGIRFFSAISQIITGQKITDCTSGFRAINEPLLKYYSKSLPREFPDAEAIILASYHGFQILEVPVTMRPRITGKSSIGFHKSIYYPFKVFISIMATVLREKKVERSN